MPAVRGQHGDSVRGIAVFQLLQLRAMQAAPRALVRDTTLKGFTTMWLCGMKVLAAGPSMLMEATPALPPCWPVTCRIETI